MLDLLQIKQQLEEKRYEDANSLFELRLLLMDLASVITRKHISNFKHRKDVKMSAMLLKAFAGIRSYYYIAETTKQDHLACFTEIKGLTLTDISTLLASQNSQDYKILPLQKIAGASLGMAK